MRGTLLRGAELRYLPLDLGLDVQRRLALLRPADVAGDHEIADLRAQALVDARRGEAAEVPLDVQGLLPAARAPDVGGLQQLADLLLLLGPGGRAGGHGVGGRGVALV